MGKQFLLLTEKDNPEAAVHADTLIKLYQEAKEFGEKIKQQEEKMSAILNELGKNRVIHQGWAIELTHTEAKEKIKVKKIRDGKLPSKK